MFKRLSIFFEHNRAERNGTIAMVIIVLLILAGTFFFTEFYSPPQKDMSQFAAFFESEKSKSAPLLQDSLNSKLFPFNPNTLSDSGYAQLGFSEKEIRMLRNYQKAGATFKVKSDFKRLFFVDSAEFRELKPFIQLPDSISSQFERKYARPSGEGVSWSDTSTYKPFIKNENVELNTADTNALKSLNGIGSFYARQIVKYRTELGGYHNLGQLLELWKMDASKIDLFADRIFIDQSLIQTIPINHLTSQELAQHPYIDLHLASKLIYSRESEGLFKNLEDLRTRQLVNAELSSKLAPYLDFK